MTAGRPGKKREIYNVVAFTDGQKKNLETTAFQKVLLKAIFKIKIKKAHTGGGRGERP